MDRAQEDLQNLGCIGVFKQSFKLISHWRKIFSQITLALIVPLSLTVLVRAHISKYIFDLYLEEEDEAYYEEIGQASPSKHKSNLPIIFEIGYLTFLIISSLLSTSAVVYTIACIYSAKETSFKSVMRVVPRVWKRLLLTFVIGYVTLCAIAFLGFVLWVVMLNQFLNPPFIIFWTIVILLVFGLGFAYTYMIWNMAAVVSVLEEINAFKSIRKSMSLINGHLLISILLFVLQSIAFAGLSVAYEFILYAEDLNLGIKILVGVSCFVLLVIVFLLVLVIQTVIYFVCKSYHHENVDRALLADHLEASYGAYVRLEGCKEVELETVQASV